MLAPKSKCLSWWCERMRLNWHFDKRWSFKKRILKWQFGAVFPVSLVWRGADGSDTPQGLSPDCKDVSVISSCVRTVSCAPRGGGWIIADLFFPSFELCCCCASGAKECAFPFALHSSFLFFFSLCPPSGPSIADPHGKERGERGSAALYSALM